MSIAPPFEQIVFSGGGIRCFWHGGWMKVVSAQVDFAPDRISGVSGGALSAASWLAGKERKLIDTMKLAFAEEDDNVTWHDMDTEDGLTPHQRVYAAVVEEVIDAKAQEAIANGPAFQILLGRPPKAGPDILQSLAAGLAYEVEKRFEKTPRSDFPGKLGVGAELIDARAAARAGHLPDLIRIAATIPPIFRIEHWDGKPAVDGGMVDQAPLPDPDEGRTLILLTRDYDDLPQDDRLVFLQPSGEVLDGKIDFTDPRKLERAWSLGEADGQAYLDRLNDPD